MTLLKLNLNGYWIRWFVLVIMAVISVITTNITQNIVPLLVALFAVIFLTATLVQEQQRPHTLFVYRFVCAILLMLFSLGAFNYLVNPFGLYPPHLFEPILLTTRNNKMNFYEAYSSPPQAVILSSSRSFTVDPNQIEHLWHYSTFNASLASGNMQDFIAFVRYMVQVAKLPKLLILDVAPEVFPQNADPTIYEPNARLWKYVDNDDPLSYQRVEFDRFTRLLSTEQLEASFRVFQAEVIGKPPSEFYLDANGMGHFTVTHLSDADLDPAKLANHVWVKLFKQFRPDAHMFDPLQQILELAKQQHMLVIGYMPPYHPRFHDALLKETDFTFILNYVSGQLDNFEKDYPFHYVNFIDSPSFSSGDEMFYDVIHPNEQASAMMMQQLYDQFHTYVQP